MQDVRGRYGQGQNWLIYRYIHKQTAYGNNEKEQAGLRGRCAKGTPVNAQTQRIREKLSRHEALATPRSRALGQIAFCEGCCCGRTDRGFKPLPRDWIERQWKDEKLNKTVQLTISGCLGPCDLANVSCVISPQGIQWFGGLQEQWQYGLLLDWAKASRDAGVLLELPAELGRHRFERFAVSEPREQSVCVQSPTPGRCCQEVSP